MKETAAGNRTERRKEATRRKIISLAMSLFREQGVDATTMEQIAREVDIAKGTLYNYYPVKEAIIADYIQQSFSNQNPARVEQFRELADTRSRMEMILGTLMDGIQAQPEIFERFLVYQVQNMISVHREAGIKSGLRLLAREIVDLGQRAGELRADVPFDILVALFEFTFVELAQEYYLSPADFDARLTINYCVDLFMNGARAV